MFAVNSVNWSEHVATISILIKYFALLLPHANWMNIAFHFFLLITHLYQNNYLFQFCKAY